jgi:dynein heavy chain, axonemal
MINQSRESYRSVAFRASILFFCINDLSLIDHMYQYSLQWFTLLFEAGVENAPASTQLDVRLQNLNDHFTYSLYQNVCRSLFESHKLLFSTLLTHRILNGDHKIDNTEWRFLLAGFQGDVEPPVNPTNWIQDNQWTEFYRQIHGLNMIPAFAGKLLKPLIFIIFNLDNYLQKFHSKCIEYI